MTGAGTSEMICDGGRPLWPVRWNLLRHGTWKYAVTAIPQSGAGFVTGRRYGCCEHCEHDINDPPHDIPCPEGCKDDDE